MNYRMPYFYKEFRCVGGVCPDSCCAGWEIDVDEESRQRYEAMEGPWGEKIRSTMKELDGETVFPLVNGNCPFWNNDHLCDMQIAHGEEILCHICHDYPRFVNSYGSTIERGMYFSCPEVVRIVFSNPKPMTFITETDEQEVTEVNDIDAELYFQLRPIRQQLISILQDRTMPVWVRLGICMKLAEKVQEKIDKKKIDKIAKVREKFSNQNYLEKLKHKLSDKKSRHEIYVDTTLCVAKQLLLTEVLTERWTRYWTQIQKTLKMDSITGEHSRFIRKQFAKRMQNREFEYEHLLVYIIYRHFLEGVHEGDVLWRVQFAALALIAVASLGQVEMEFQDENFPVEMQMDLMHLFSREIEHSEPNLAFLKGMLSTKEKLQPKHLVLTVKELLCTD